MKTYIIAIAAFVSATVAALLFCRTQTADLPLNTLSYEVIGQSDRFVRDEHDKRYSIWTDDDFTAQELARSFGLDDLVPFKLSPGQVLVAFLNDRIEDKLDQIIAHSGPNRIFADYVDSGIRYKILGSAGDGKKYSVLTLVVFTPPVPVGHYGMRRLVDGGLSEKKDRISSTKPLEAYVSQLIGKESRNEK